jgi:hypothetical protein
MPHITKEQVRKWAIVPHADARLGPLAESWLVLDTEVASLIAERSAERKGIRLLLAGQQVGCSTGIDDLPTYGYGKLDDRGFWEYPVPEELVRFKERLNKLEVKYRQKLWAAHAHPFSMRYGDDGEMQCGNCDFKRAPLEDCEKHCNGAAVAAIT